MFTGIVETCGKIISIFPFGKGKRIEVSMEKALNELSPGESVAINGVCLTVVTCTSAVFSVDISEETVRKSTMQFVRPGDRVNLERAIHANAKFGGHFVLGHVDCIGHVLGIEKRSSCWMYAFSFAERMKKYLVPEGSIAIDGVSLTISAVEGESFSVAVVPYTFEKTIIQGYQRGTAVNYEFDIIGKYVISALENSSFTKKFLTLKHLGDLGY
ncbi:MAG: riboflavin synthase [Bacteroidota bacterium]|nr:riboflavin synthase [Bacteroidota bacterium]